MKTIFKGPAKITIGPTGKFSKSQWATMTLHYTVSTNTTEKPSPIEKLPVSN